MAHKPVTEGDSDLSRKANLIQRAGRWYFNRAYPKDLWPLLGKAPFRLSLRTDSLEVALRRRPDAERRYFAAVDKARGQQVALAPRQLTEIDAVAIAARWFQAEDMERTADLARPLAGLLVEDDVAEADKRDPFTTAQLNEIFSQAPWKPRDENPHGKPLHFWGPLIALFHGMRRGEIAQLDTDSITEVSGHPVILIRAGTGKRLKTVNARRMLPIHPELIKMGFLAYVRRQPAAFDQDEEARSEWKRAASKVHAVNARRKGKRLALMQRLWVAEKLADFPAIYFPHSMDWRGRVYPIPAGGPSPQGDDIAKALLTFATGLPLGSGGARWLAIHLANLFGVDKVSFEDRIRWVEENEAAILDSAAQPLDGQRFWTKADKPWQALAAWMRRLGWPEEVVLKRIAVNKRVSLEKLSSVVSLGFPYRLLREPQV